MKHVLSTIGALATAGALYMALPGRAPVADDPPAGAATTMAPPQAPPVPIGPLPAHVERALDWLAGAQQPDGGFGAGSHARQEIREPSAVPTDPATTAVAAMALLRAGNTLADGAHAGVLRRATDYLLHAVEQATEQGPQITTQTGTQPQAKLGQNVDTALTAQYFARLLQDLEPADAARPRVERALDKCLRKIESAQASDGNWGGGGWAPVLQAAQMCTALELGELAGRPVDKDKLDQARSFQRGQVRSGGGAAAGAPGLSVARAGAAGIELYALAANMRNIAAEAKAAEQLVETAKQQGRLRADAAVDGETLRQLGVDASRSEAMAQSAATNAATKVRAFDENVLAGFGNNGGEEFLSYQMKSEALVIDGGEEWTRWEAKMHERLAKVQNQDGSWSGHHCITSPTFCTASAISCLTAGRDVAWLKRASVLAAR